MSPTGTRAGTRAVVGAVVGTVAAVLPVFLLGGLSVLVGADLGFSPAGLGVLVSAYFASAALTSLPAGRLVERYGPTVTTRAGVLVAGAAMAFIAAGARSYATLLLALVVAGVANSLVQLGSNASLAQAVRPGRMGLAFGIKQAAIPIGTLVAGVAVPAIGLTVGWRWAFAVAAGVASVAVLTVPVGGRGRAPTGSPAPLGSPGSPARPRAPRVASRGLWVVAAAAALAAGVANSLGAFLVDSAVTRGLSPGPAGVTLAVASAVGVAARIGSGALADRRDGGHLTVVAGMLASGALGVALLAAPGTIALAGGALLAFGLGWSWPGLLNFAVVRLHPTAPATATSVTQLGVSAGSSVGPLGFGALVQLTSYGTGWLVAAAAMVAAAALLLVGRRLLVRDLRGPSGQGRQRGVLVVGEVDPGGRDVLLQVGDLPGAGDRQHDR